jgi:hypothetical protein
MANKYIAVIDGETVGKRTSKSREYSHCIAVKWCRVYALKAVSDPRRMAMDAKNWAHWMESEHNQRYTRAEFLDRAKAASSGEEYADAEMRRSTNNIMRDTDRYASWHVITWCGRPDLAAKEHAKWSGRADVAQCRILDAIKL